MPDKPECCPICQKQEISLWSDAKDYEYLTSQQTYDYYKCENCYTIFISPLPEAELKIIYPENYYSFKGEQRNWAFRIKEILDKKLFRKILKEIKHDSINVLDIGGGTGWLLDHIKSIDPRINITQVVDIDPTAKQIAEKKGHLFFEGKIEDFITSRQFHLILMLNLIEHVSMPVKVLQNAEKVLTPDGIVLIKTPNTQSADATIFRKSYWGGLHCPRHWTIFSEKSFRIAVAETNLLVKTLNYTQGGPFWAFSIIVYLSRKNILTITSEHPVINHPLFPFISSLFAIFDFARRPFFKTSQLFISLKKK